MQAKENELRNKGLSTSLPAEAHWIHEASARQKHRPFIIGVAGGTASGVCVFANCVTVMAQHLLCKRFC